jgi:hypothetical protein
MCTMKLSLDMNRKAIWRIQPGCKLRKDISEVDRLFEDVAILPGKLLAITGHWNIPGPQILDYFAVRLTGVVKFLELIAFPIWCDIECREVLRAAGHEGTTDNAVIILTIYGGSTKKEFARSLKAGEETTYVLKLAVIEYLDARWFATKETYQSDCWP